MPEPERPDHDCPTCYQKINFDLIPPSDLDHLYKLIRRREKDEAEAANYPKARTWEDWKD